MDKLKRLGYLISLASVLQIAESYFPHPLPGVKFGFANLIVMLSIFEFGIKEGLYIAVMRVLVSSFVLGIFLSPSFILSFSGAVMSSLFMGIFISISWMSKFFYFSAVGISVIGSLIHTLTQILLIYTFFIKSRAVFGILPFIILGSFITGIINGIIGRTVLNKSGFVSGNINFRFNIRNLENYKEKRISTGILLTVFLITTILIVLSNIREYFYILAFEIFLFFVFKVEFKKFFGKFKKILIFLFFSFFLPAVFDKDVDSGLRYFLRLFLFSNLSFIVFSKISFYNIRKFFRNYRIFKKEIFIIGFSISIYPVIFDRIKGLINVYFYNLKRKSSLFRKLGLLVSDLYSGKNF